MTAIAIGAASVAIVSAVPAQAAPRGCEGPVIKSVEMVTDQGQIGVLDPGDVFTITFQRPIAGVDYAGSEIRFVGANGETAYQSHPGGEFEATNTNRSITVTINELQISGTPNEIALPLPATISSISGIYTKNDRTNAPVSLACSKDVVLD